MVAEIAAARDGAEALEYLFGQGRYAGRDTHRHPSFILLEIKRPKLSGLDLLRSNPLTALVPVVILTSSSERSDMEACYRSGANGFVGNPVDFGELTEKLDRLQAYRLGVNESIASVYRFATQPLKG